jgi:hypothetical protein
VPHLGNPKQTLEYISDRGQLAASLWAEAKQQPTADSKALDGDVILSAQARLFYDETTEVIVATTNVAHLNRFITALDWPSLATYLLIKPINADCSAPVSQ